MTKFRSICFVILTTSCDTSAWAAPGALEDDELTRGTTRPWRSEDVPSLFTEAEVTASTTFYSRNRHATDHADDIHVDALSLGVDWRSGYAAGPWGFVGADLSGFTNLRLAPRTRLSGVLYHDYRDGADKTYATLAQAALKWRSGATGDGWQVRAGYTPISVGTLGTSGGLHSHAYRGAELKYRAGGWEIGYGLADQFRNEWDNRFRPMTNARHQNRDQYDGTASRIDFVHSVGIRYEANADSSVDAGAGEGRRYRRNAQVAATRAWRIADSGTVTTTAYALWGRYEAALGPVAAPRDEWHASTSVGYASGPFTVSLGFGVTHAPDSGEMNFRLTDLPPGRARKSSFKPLNIKDYSETLRGRAYCQRHRHGPGEVQSQSLKDGVLLGIEARQTGRQLPVDLIVQVRETGQGEQRFVEVHRVGIVIGGAEGMV